MNLLFIALLFVAAVAHPADFYETNIKGDRVVIDTLKDVRGEFDPSVTLTKWSEEESLKLTFKHDRKFTSDVKTIDNKVRVTNDNMTVDYYTDDKEFKIIIEFRSRPRTNTYTFDLEGWENFNFWYQPALTQDEIDEGCTRPDNVVGSYAVYHKTKKNHASGQTNYMTGKAFHIYRPRFIDDVGSWTWVDLHIAGGVYTVTIPQKFLDTCVYPIKANDTFGYTSAGASGDSAFATSASSATMYGDGDVTAVTAHCQSDDAPVSEIRGGVWADDTSYPGDLEASGALSTTITGGNAWVESAVSPAASLSSGAKWVGIRYEAGASNSEVSYDSTGINSYEDGTTGTLPDPFPGGASLRTGRQYSVYATYTPAAPAAAPTGAVPQILILE